MSDAHPSSHCPPSPFSPHADAASSHTVRYREMVHDDWDAVFALACRLWYGDIEEIDDEEVRLLSAIIDTSIIAKRTAWGVVALDDLTDQIVGVICASGPTAPGRRIQGLHEVAIAKALARGDEIGVRNGDDTGRHLRAFEADMRRFSDETLARYDTSFDSEITLLILDKAYQGRGIGRELMERALAWCRQVGATQVVLDTDDSCNYPFYDHLGWTRVQEFDAHVDIFGKRWDMTEYIYAFDL